MGKTTTIWTRQVLPLTLLVVAASSFKGNNNPSLPHNNNPFHNDNLPNGDDNDDNDNQKYSLNQHVSYDPEEEKMSVSVETETVAFFGDEKRSSSSLNALFCNGGGDNASMFVAMAECRFEGNSPDFDSDMEDEDESEDEDDDDNDGHGMMLSNASFRRSLVAASGGSSSSAHSTPKKSTSDKIRHNTLNVGGERFSKSKVVTSIVNRKRVVHTPFVGRSARNSPSVTKALSLRGGDAPPAATLFARKLLVAAIVTLMYEGAIGHLLEFVKIVMQTSPPDTTYADVLRLITAEKGIAGVWDGFVPWGIVQAVGKGGVFGLARAVALSYLLPLVDSGTLPKQVALTLAGGIAGGFQGYVLSPTLLLKTRVMTNPVFREKISLLRTTILSLKIGFDVVVNEGLLALMKGANIFALKRVFDWSTRFYFADVFSKILREVIGKDLTPMQKIYADLLGGTASTISTLPLDVLVAKTQDSKKAGVKVSVVKMFRDELNEKGLKGLKDSYMKGFEARLLHVCFTTVVMKSGTALMYDYLYKD